MGHHLQFKSSHCLVGLITTCRYLIPIPHEISSRGRDDGVWGVSRVLCWVLAGFHFLVCVICIHIPLSTGPPRHTARVRQNPWRTLWQYIYCIVGQCMYNVPLYQTIIPFDHWHTFGGYLIYFVESVWKWLTRHGRQPFAIVLNGIISIWGSDLLWW